MADTKETLLLTAERLFAERGIRAVSLREIGEQAGQRNTGVVHYHFGDKTGLVSAILAYRTETINARRQELLAEIEADGRSDDVVALAGALVLPLAEQVNDTSRYVGFLARLQSEPGWTERREGQDPALSSSYGDVVRLLRKALRDLPVAVFDNRVLLVTTLIPQALAAHQAGERPPGGRTLPTAAFVADLVSVVAAALAAPPAAAAQRR